MKHKSMRYLFEIGKEPAKIIQAENIIEAHKIAKELAMENNCKGRFMPVMEENACYITPPKL